MILLLSLLLLTLNAETPKKVTLQLKWKHQFQSAGFIVAKEKGFYRDVGIDIEMLEYGINTKTIDDLKAGKTDFAVSDSSSIFSRMNGSKIKGLLAILQKSPYILIALKSSKIDTLEEINGKKIALVDRQNGIVLSSLLQSNHINYERRNASFGFEELLNKEVDLLTGYISNEPFVAQESNISINIFNPADYGFDGYGDILITSEKLTQTDPELVSRMYEATKKGWVYAFENIEEVSEIIHSRYNTLNKSKKSLIYEGEKLKDLSGYGEKFGTFDLDKIKAIGQLFSFIIQGKYNASDLDSFVYETTRNGMTRVYFTEEEQEYLESIDTIPMCYNTTLAPYTMIENGQPVGASVEYLKAIEKKINKKFKFIYSNSINKQFTMIYQRKCSAIPLVQRAPQAVPFIQPTLPMGKDNLVLVTKMDEPYIFNMDKLKSKKIGINSEYRHLAAYLDKNHPEIKYIKIEGDGLEEVKQGKLFGAIGTSVMMNYHLNKNFKDSLKVMTVYPDSYIEGSIGVHEDEPILLSILNKAVASLPAVTQEYIFEKWIYEKYEKVTDYELLYKIMGVALTIVVAFFAWNIRLHEEIRKRKKVEYEKTCAIGDLEKTTAAHIDFIKDLPIGIISSDPTGKETSYCNRTFLQMFGWELEDIDPIDKWFTNAYPDEEYRAEIIRVWGERIEEAVVQNKPYSDPMEVNVTCKDGSTKWCQVHYYEKKQFLNAGLFVDISERKHAEDQLSKLNDSLEEEIQIQIVKNEEHQLIEMEQIKLARMGEMIANIAHQWRQPLAQINSSIMVIDVTLDKNAFQDEVVNSKLLEIEKLTQHMSETIDNFQNFFNPEREATLFHPKQIVDSSTNIIQGTLSSNFTSVTVNIGESLEMEGFPSELQQVIVVLLSNANDILVEREVVDPEIIVGIEDLSHAYILSVSDNAGGVEAENLDKVFEPYYTTKHKSQGRGVGLYMAKMIIEEGMGGRLTLENGKSGAVFSIEIPKGMTHV